MCVYIVPCLSLLFSSLAFSLSLVFSVVSCALSFVARRSPRDDDACSCLRLPSFLFHQFSLPLSPVCVSDDAMSQAYTGR